MTNDPFNRTPAKKQPETAEPMASMEPRKPGGKCDCLNKCGDDPWLLKGLVIPCDTYERAQERESARAKLKAEQDEVRARFLDRLNLFPELNKFTLTREELIALVVEVR